MILSLPLEIICNITKFLDIESYFNLLYFSELMKIKSIENIEFNNKIRYAIKSSIINSNKNIRTILKIQKNLKSCSIRKAMNFYSEIYYNTLFKLTKFEVYESKLLVKLINNNLEYKKKLFMAICGKINKHEIFIAKNKHELAKLNLCERKIKLLYNIIN